MSFEHLFKTVMLSEDFGKERYMQRYKERAHMSKSRLDAYSNVRYLDVNANYMNSYRDELSVRYASALNISYDLLVSLFNVDTGDTLVCRTFGSDENMKSFMGKYLASLGKKGQNLEVRLIGMQSGQEHGYLYDLAEMISAKSLPLVEVDLFGDEVRHIAIDTKLGVSYNVLLENRLYKAMELKNATTIEQFERSLTQAAPG